jgi:hypothetical protein
MGAGWAITLAPMTSAVMGSAGPDQAGIASAVTNTSRELGGVLGVAVLGAIVTSAFGRAVSDRLVDVGVPVAKEATIVQLGVAAAAGGPGTTDPVPAEGTLTSQDMPHDRVLVYIVHC